MFHDFVRGQVRVEFTHLSRGSRWGGVGSITPNFAAQIVFAAHCWQTMLAPSGSEAAYI